MEECELSISVWIKGAVEPEEDERQRDNKVKIESFK